MIINNTGIFGPDISFYQDNDLTPQKVDFVKMKNYGASFVIIKAGQDYYRDEDFLDYWRDAKLAGLPRGSYFFGDKDGSGVSQARKHWDIIKDDIGEGPHFVDYEEGSWTDWNQLYDYLYEFKRLSGLPNNRIGIYTRYNYWMEHSPSNIEQRQWFGQFLLWIAHYTSNPDIVRIPHPWSECLLWQQGTPAIGYEMGVESREIDYNIFNGDATKFRTYFGASPTPPTGEPMVLYYADLKDGYTSRVRTGPGLSYPIVTTLTGPLTVSIVSEKTTIDGYDWYQISSPVGYIALTTSYTNFRPAPTSSPYPVKVTVELSDGSTYVCTNLVKQ